MSYETIVFDVQDAVATVTLNRPEMFNALNTTMYRELGDAFRKIARDPAVRCVVLTGAGRGFCSGQDLAELQGLLGTLSVTDVLRSGLNKMIHNIRTLEKPVIGAINGVAAGAGSSLAFATDLRMMSEQASFVLAAFTNIGIIPDGGSTYLLPQLVGVNKALELAWLADRQNRVSANDAKDLGLVNWVVPADNLAQEAQAVAQKLASLPTKALGMSKRAMYRAIATDLADALNYEAEVQAGAFQTKDFQEGIQSFLEKREPKFTGE